MSLNILNLELLAIDDSLDVEMTGDRLVQFPTPVRLTETPIAAKFL